MNGDVRNTKREVSFEELSVKRLIEIFKKENSFFLNDNVLWFDYEKKKRKVIVKTVKILRRIGEIFNENLDLRARILLITQLSSSQYELRKVAYIRLQQVFCSCPGYCDEAVIKALKKFEESRREDTMNNQIAIEAQENHWLCEMNSSNLRSALYSAV